MKSIQKSITRKYKDKRNALIFIGDQNFNLLILAFFIILGLELYFLNHYLNNALYLCGPGSGIFGSLLFLRIRSRNQTKRKLEYFYKQSNDNVIDSVSFNEEFLGIELANRSSNKYYWDILIDFRETKKHIIVTMADIDFYIVKKHFSDVELNEIIGILQIKMASQSWRNKA